MYQSVDIDTPDNEPKAHTGRSRLRRHRKSAGIAGLIAASLLLFALAYSYKNGPESVNVTLNDSETARLAYIKAISEPNAALRRARLQDFVQNHTTNDRSQAASRQLELLNAYETRDWNYITKIAYENSLSHTERLNALEDYNRRWGGELLGGRSENIEALRAEILNLPDRAPKPDRRLQSSPSPISPDIKSDSLVGEPQRTAIYIPPKRTIPAPPPVIRKTPDKVIPPKVRRNITPRYPRKALRRNIGALVVLNLNIDARGRVQLTELVEVRASRYQKEFIKAAERAALRTRFEPQIVNGQAVPVSGIQKRYRFRP